MLKITDTACIDASPDEVWEVLSDVENIPLWSEVVLSASISSNTSKGIGTERVCNLKNNITITERWVAWDEGRSFTYEGYNLPMTQEAKNTWSVQEKNGKTLLKTEAVVILKGGFFGKLIEPLMKVAASRMGSDALASFKYLVEHGHAYEGKHSLLPRAPAIC